VFALTVEELVLGWVLEFRWGLTADADELVADPPELEEVAGREPLDSDEDDVALEVTLVGVDIPEEVVDLLAEPVKEFTAPDTLEVTGTVFTASAPARSEARRTMIPATTAKNAQNSNTRRPRNWTRRRGVSSTSSSLLPCRGDVIEFLDAVGERERVLRSPRSTCFSGTPANHLKPKNMDDGGLTGSHGCVARYCSLRKFLDRRENGGDESVPRPVTRAGLCVVISESSEDQHIQRFLNGHRVVLHRPETAYESVHLF
jgi:hypothetical protein